jgi:hypothetical protein
MNTKTVSFRTQLKGTLSDFLKKEDMCCPQTEEGLLELVVALSHYTEEGHSLFPQVVLCDDIETTLGLLQCSDSLKIGFGTRDQSTILLSLKRCAPLARGGWVIYIQRLPGKIEYGVFRSPSSPTALDIRDTVLALTQEAEHVHIIVVSQMAEKAVELVGASSGVLHVYLSATPDDAPSPQDALTFLINACCEDIPEAEKEQVESFLRTSLLEAVRQCHGTLIGVLAAAHEPSSETGTGVIFERRISVRELVKKHKIQRSDQTLASLTAHANLLAGMLASDGITLLDSTAALIGYNLLLEQPSAEKSNAIKVPGFARRRAYSALCGLVDDGKLRGCFIRTSEGGSEYYAGRGKSKRGSKSKGRSKT